MHKIIESIQHQSDDLIIEKVLEGDTSLFEVLIRRYNPVLYRIARSYGFNHQDAEDLMQDTHIIAYTRLSQFEGRASYKTWISRIMINRCIYKLKYGYFSREIRNDTTSACNNNFMQTNDKAQQAGALLENRELSVILEKSIQNIPLNYRTVFILREIEGFTVAETAGLLHITSINVKVRLNRAKALLQKQIEQFYSRAEVYSFNLIYCDAIVNRTMSRIRELENID